MNEKRTAGAVTSIQPSKYVLEVNLHTIMSTKLRVFCQFKEEISKIFFQICDISNDVDDQYWAYGCLFRDIINEHEPLNTKSIKK